MNRTIALRLAALQKRRKAQAAKALALRIEEARYRSVLEQLARGRGLPGDMMWID
jgi:hypothetical protein